MKIKNKILASNLIAILTTVSIILFIFLIFFISFKNITGINFKTIKRYRYSVENIDKKAEIFIDTIEHSNSKKQKEYYLKNFKNYLDSLGYRVKLYNKKFLILNTLTSEDEVFLNRIKYYENYRKENNILKIENKSIINKSFSINDNSKYNLIILNEINDNFALDLDYFLEKLISYIVLFLLLSILIIFINNILLAGYLSNFILNPLKKLRYATEKIKKNDYEYEIEYFEENEFREVIEQFNDMKSKLEISEKQQKLYEKNRRELIAGISHDLRTPLTSIKGYTKGIIDGIAKSEEKRSNYLKKILNKTEELENLIDILNNYSKLEGGKVNFNFEKINFSNYITNIIIKLKKYSEKNVYVQFKDNTEKNNIVEIDIKQFNRVIFNIIENAIKYGKKEEKDCVEIDITLTKKHEFIVLEIKDNGLGVRDEYLDRIFEVFYRTDKARKNPGEGSGLGLSIAKRIIEGHKGEIKAINENGLKIKIKLPIRRN